MNAQHICYYHEEHISRMHYKLYIYSYHGYAVVKQLVGGKSPRKPHYQEVNNNG